MFVCVILLDKVKAVSPSVQPCASARRRLNPRPPRDFYEWLSFDISQGGAGYSDDAAEWIIIGIVYASVLGPLWIAALIVKLYFCCPCCPCHRRGDEGIAIDEGIIANEAVELPI